MTTSNTQFTWWEKTVEYLFIQKHIKIKDMISPLDGDHERAGDAIFGKQGKWCIIEFKRDAQSIMSEEGKFVDWTKAMLELCDKDKSHFLIYGSAKDTTFHLNCIRYFSRERLKINDALESGSNFEEFNKYLCRLISLKKKKKNEDPVEGSSGGFSSVAIMQKNETGTKCMSFEEYGVSFHREMTLDLSIGIDPPKPKRKGPHMGR